MSCPEILCCGGVLGLHVILVEISRKHELLRPLCFPGSHPTASARKFVSSQTRFSFNSLLDSQEALKPIILTSVFVTIKEQAEEKHGPEPGKSIPEGKPQCGQGVGVGGGALFFWLGALLM